MNDPDLLKAAMAGAGLTARRFAVDVLDVDERNIRRWLQGTRELQGTVRVVCVAILERPALAAELARARANAAALVVCARADRPALEVVEETVEEEELDD